MKEFGGVWGGLGGFGGVWGGLGGFGGVWGGLGKFGEILESLGEFRGVWGSLGKFGEILGSLGEFGGVWGSFLGKFWGVVRVEIGNLGMGLTNEIFFILNLKKSNKKMLLIKTFQC